MKHLTESRLFLRFWDIAGGVSIRVKVLGIVIGVIILLSLFVTVQMQRVLFTTLRHDLMHQGEALAAQFAHESADFIEAEDYNGLSLHLIERQIHYSSEGHNTHVQYIKVVGADGEVIASSGTEDRTNEAILLTIAPIADTGATVDLALGQIYIQQTVYEVLFQLLTITLVMIAVGFAAAFFLTWILTRPIYDLVGATQAVAQGDFTQRVPSWANDEIGELAIAFNQMTSSLQQAEQERVERETLRNQYVSKVIDAQEEERKRISRELHDSTGQSLTSLLIGLKHLKESCHQDDLIPQIDDLRSAIGSTLTEVRAIAWQLRPSALDDLGLIVALERYVDDYQKRYNIKVDFVANGIHERLPIELETVIYRIVQEALTNIARHAQASIASIFIDSRKTTLRIIVEDNGIGFDPNQPHKSLGIQGIRERAALFNGTLIIETQPNQGTALFVEVPMEKQS